MTTREVITGLDKTLRKVRDWKQTFMTKHRSRLAHFYDIKQRMDHYTGVAHCDHGTIRSEHDFLTLDLVSHVIKALQSNGSPYLSPDDRFMADNFRRIFSLRRGILLKKKGLSDEEIGFIVRHANNEPDLSKNLDKAYHAIIKEQATWQRATDLEIEKGKRLLALLNENGETHKHARFTQQLSEITRERDLSYVLLSPLAQRSIKPDHQVNLQRRHFIGIAVPTFLAGITASLFVTSEWSDYLKEYLNSTFDEYESRERLRAYYRSKHSLYNDVLYRRFVIPEFFQLNQTIANCAISIPFDEFYGLVKDMERFYHRMYIPSRRIRAFAKGIHHPDGQMRAGGYRFSKDMLNPDHLTICSVLAFINRNVDYTSDYKYRKDKQGNRVLAPGSEEHAPPYNMRDYPKYPEQTLIDGYGDCEDFSILAASLLSSLLADVKAGVSYFTKQENDDHVILALEVNLPCAATFARHISPTSERHQTRSCSCRATRNRSRGPTATRAIAASSYFSNPSSTCLTPRPLT